MDRQVFDTVYIDGLRAGDPDTERHFVSYFSSLILIKVRSRAWLKPLAEDIRQETLLRALAAVRAEDGLRDAKKLGSFVNAVCNNVMMELMRKDKRHNQVPEQPGQSPGPSVATTPEDQFITEEHKAIVRSIIGDLAPRDRQLLQTIFLEEREKEEVCQALSVDRDYLRVLLHRAKAQFRNLYLKEVVTSGGSEHLASRGPRPRRAK